MSSNPNARLLETAATIERFLEGRFLRSSSVDTRTAADSIDGEVETIIAIAVDTRDRILGRK